MSENQVFGQAEGGYRKCLKLLYVMMKKFLEKIFIKL